ncbi:hypothetical protein PsorP6_016434 [Peronosclerospora sorghi]|uniref:Uncharacterized protein n=1 Tax=Peronosclerospora sorghi TaxID=230839 RepID=A0ACC0VTG0_9STRA|nr:hypothetical protein PsorP6_016434 [Peronosclerospora sorghi]
MADQPFAISDESIQPPLLSDTSSVTIGDEDDTVERENKRPRVDSYEIALAAKDVPQTYAEAMASDEAEQWKQAFHTAAVWYKAIRDVFLTMGFSQCRADTCFFVRRECDGDDEYAVYFVLYVDDLLVGCARDEDAEKVRDELSARFTLKSLGVSPFVLGMEVKYDMEKAELIMKQEQFITKMLQKSGCHDAHATRNPMVLGQDLVPTDDNEVFDDKTKYRDLVGSFWYVDNATRPDVSVALSVLSQYLDSPQEMHWRAAKRILCYLKGTKGHGIQYTRDKKNNFGSNVNLE